jgi:phage nucleotide-binding protein
VSNPNLAVLTERTLGGLQLRTVAESIDFINLLVYGDPGVGKTVLAGSAAELAELSPVLFIDVEGGTFSIRERYPEIDVVRVKTWLEFQKLYDELYRDMKYRTIVLDSLTEIQKFSMYIIMLDLIKSDTSRDPDVPGMREWGKNTEQIRRLVRAFRDLPCNTIFTALARTTRDPKSGLDKTRPGLSGQLSGEVAGFVDIVAYMYVKTVPPDGLKRLLLTTATDTQVAKDRSDRLPAVVEEPSMKVLYDFMFHDKAQGDN